MTSTRRRTARGSRAPAAAGGLERLWAPWRMTFIESAHGARGCLFCRVMRERDDRTHLVLARRRHGVLMLNRYPYAPGHLMVAVARHVGGFQDLTAAERDDLLALAALGERLLAAEYRPHGFNLGANLGTVAGAGFPGHLHLHLVPRWNGDTNFMPIVAATRVLPESLASTYRRLARRGVGAQRMAVDARAGEGRGRPGPSSGRPSARRSARPPGAGRRRRSRG